MAPSSHDIAAMRRLRPLLFAVAMGLGCLLASPTAEAREVVHVVQKGQWLDVIAKRYHTTADAILKRNAMRSNDLKPGMKLIIVETEEHRKWRQAVEKKTGKPVAERVHREKPAPKKAAPKKASKPRPAPKRAEKRAPAPAPTTEREIKSAKQRVAPRDDGAGNEASVAKPAPSEPTPAPAASSPNASSSTQVKKSYAKAPKRPGYVTLIRYGEKFRGQLVASNGEVIAKSSKRVDHLLRSLRTGKQARINRRLLGLLTKVSDHFGGRTIVIVSGFRPYSAKQYTRNSRHNHGEAVDFKVTGVPTDVVFERCRQFDDVGCGYYPNSGFIHMDVRGRNTQWTDYSRPGQAPNYAKRKKHPSRAAPSKPAAQQPAVPDADTDGRGAKRNTAAKD